MKNLFQFLLFYSFLSYAQVPAYYNSIDFDRDGNNLKIDLAYLITITHTTELPYTSSDTDTWDAVTLTDVDPSNNANVLLFYGYQDYDGNPENDYTRDKYQTCHTTSCTGLWTREHVFAKSLANPSLTTDDPGPGTDVHNLRACDGDMNVTRSNLWFQDDSGNAHITSAYNWYPGDEWKGDVARIIMYMYLRYPSQCLPNNTGVGAHTYHADMPDVFLQWNADDTVSQYETQRNTVLETLQGNRNPFIDNPYLATKIWGGEAAQDTWGLLNTDAFAYYSIKVVPTLVSEQLYILNTSDTKIEAMVYNMSGQIIKVPLENKVIYVETLKDGMYFIKITDSDKTATFKFIKH